MFWVQYEFRFLLLFFFLLLRWNSFPFNSHSCLLSTSLGRVWFVFLYILVQRIKTFLASSSSHQIILVSKCSFKRNCLALWEENNKPGVRLLLFFTISLNALLTSLKQIQALHRCSQIRQCT